MTRILRCVNHCSPMELVLLKSIRALAHHDDLHPSSGAHLEKLGLVQYRVFFSSLIKRLKIEDVGFHFYQTESPFLSVNEIGLLTMLAKACCKGKSPFTADSQSALHRSLNECGVILQQNKIKLRFRPDYSETVEQV